MRRFALAAVLASVAFAPVSSMTARGQEPESPSSVSAAYAEGRDLWFVELTGAPTADGGNLTQLRNEKAAFRRAAAQAGISFEERRAFNVLWNGLSVRIDPSDVGRLSRIEGVKAIYPVATVSIPESERNVSGDAGPELATALAQTGADVAQTALGLTGAGVKVAVMDTGVDYHHPDLGSCFGPGCRVQKGYDFVGDAFNADPSSASYNPIAVPDPDPDDCNGHGTHVAGIVGANGELKGVAPGVTFLAYRVFGCTGSTTADIMISAMEQALADGADVLNMSIGSAFQWPQYPTAQASDRLVRRGVSVVASIGNSGASGLYSAGAPGVGRDVIGVASFDNSHVALQVFTISPDGAQIGYANATGAPAAPTSGSLPLARSGTSSATADGCSVGGVSPFADGQFVGQAVLIRRGTCTFHEKSRNAQLAGAAAVVLYNNSAGRFNPTVAGTPAITIPVVAISDTEGVQINNRLAAGAVTLTWTADLGTFVNGTGNLISSFSSYGLSPDLALKPDIGAPGGLIRSTYPLEAGRYATISGTSMSSPHTAGAVALLLEARPRTPPQAIRSILQNSADPRVWWGNPGLGFLDNVHRQGAGMLDIPGAILSTARIEPGKLSLGESEAGPATRTLTFRNDGSSDVVYTLAHAPALSTGPNTFTPAFFTGFASVAFSAPEVTVPAGGQASVDVTITANPSLANGSQYGGYLVATPQGGGASLRVPYAGFKGDYQSISVLNPAATTFGFPWLAKLAGGSFSNRPAGETYTMAGGDIPYLLVHLDHQSRRVRLDVVEVATGRSWHRVMTLDYVGRNANRATTSFFFALPWDGTTEAGRRAYTVPNGQYQVTISVLKALGDETDPAHVESWTSPVITIARPASSTP